MKKVKNIVALLILAVTIMSCKSVSAPKRAINDSGMMYAMVYDYDNMPVSGASVFINGKLYIETDLQGRFILEFPKKGEYAIIVAKPGYETLEDSFAYDPMNVLYLKMVNSTQLLSQAEEALDQYTYNDAETLIGRALALEPSRPDLLYFQSIVYFYQGRKAQAKDILENLLERGINGNHIVDFIRMLPD